jgi:hypothetical protein
VRLLLSADDAADDTDQRLAKDRRVPTLPPGHGRTLEVRLRARRASLEGTRLIAILDATNVVPEADETNNAVASAPLR